MHKIPRNYRSHPSNQYSGQAKHAEGANNPKSHPLKAIQMANMLFLCMVTLITILHLYLVKAIDLMKDVNKLHR